MVRSNHCKPLDIPVDYQFIPCRLWKVVNWVRWLTREKCLAVGHCSCLSNVIAVGMNFLCCALGRACCESWLWQCWLVRKQVVVWRFASAMSVGQHQLCWCHLALSCNALSLGVSLETLVPFGDFWYWTHWLLQRHSVVLTCYVKTEQSGQAFIQTV